MSKIWDFIWAHALAIYITGVIVVSFLGGYINPEEPKDHKGNPSIRADVVFFAGMWPAFAFIAALASPLWVPMLFADLGAWWAKREEQKEIVKKVLSRISPPSGPRYTCPSCHKDVTNVPVGQNCRGCGYGL